MTSDRVKSTVLKNFIFSPYIKNKVDEQSKLIEISGYLRSTKNFEDLRTIARKIDSPIGQLYEVISRGKYNDPEAFSVSNLPDRYLGISLVCIAQTLRHRGEYAPALRLCLEAMKLSQKWNDNVAYYDAQIELAIIQSSLSNHNDSLELLDRAFPLIRAIAGRRPARYYDYFNSRAVELNEVGRVEEARINVEFALASPFAPGYPEWHDTRDEIGRRGCRSARSVVTIRRPVEFEKVLVFPIQCKPSSIDALNNVSPPYKDRIIKLSEWKTRMSNKSNEEAWKKSAPEKAGKFDRQAQQREIIDRILDTESSDQDLIDFLDYLDKKKSSSSKEQ